MFGDAPGELKREILNVAAQMFHDYGYKGTTFQKIADHLGITKGAITYHFGNKYRIMDLIIQEYFDQLRAFIDSFDDENCNAYWRICVMYFYAYRVFLSSENNRALFFDEHQVCLWEQNRLPSVQRLHAAIIKDFHQHISEEEVRTNVYIDLGARRRLYHEYTQGDRYLQDVDHFVYCHVKLIGLLCGLSLDTIKTNFALAQEFVNAHEPPPTPLPWSD